MNEVSITTDVTEFAHGRYVIKFDPPLTKDETEEFVSQFSAGRIRQSRIYPATADGTPLASLSD
jgi:hypothetical protein